jgi:carboxymethylenebutenolidase
MAIKGEWIEYGDQIGYLARPSAARAPLPGVIVIQEIGGVNAHIEDVARRIAAAGYVALAPDLFAVAGKRPEPLTEARLQETWAVMATFPPQARGDPAARAAELAKLPEDMRRRVEETFTAMFSTPARLPEFVAPLREAFRQLREERPESRGARVGCVGFCMGGGLSALLACEEPELSAAAVYYGSTPPAEAVARIACPVLAFYGGLDQRVNAQIPAFEEAMAKSGRSFEKVVYEGANHAFFNDDSPVYDPGAARDSYARLLAFFARHLAG